jgi:hypothetical protein
MGLAARAARQWQMNGDVGDVGNLENKPLIHNDFNIANARTKDANIAKDAKISTPCIGIHDLQTRRQGVCLCIIQRVSRR